MSSLKQKIAKFMQGRYITYGYDAFTRFLLIVWLIVTVVSSFVRVGIFGIRIFHAVPFFIFFYIYFRLFSKNISSRYRENEAYLSLLKKFTGCFSGLKSDFQMRKNYHIYRCPVCSQKIRIPRGKGRIEVRCPKCGDKFLKVS